jgi:hypothetical protein
MPLTAKTVESALATIHDPELHGFAQYALREHAKGESQHLQLLSAVQRYPVSIETFIESADYLGMRGQIYPVVMDCLVELNNPVVEGLEHRYRLGSAYSEAVLTGAIGTGKTTFALLTTAYQLYILSCLREPQQVYGLDRASELLFIFQSVNERLAKQVDFDRFRALIAESPYFRSHFPFDKDIKSELRFPNRIIVRPVSGLETATLGQNVFGGVIDEVNFMAQVERSKRSVDGNRYDQAVALYNSISRRRKSRFMRQGHLPGMLCLVSSKRYPGQFTDQKLGEAARDVRRHGQSPIYVYDKTSWDIKPRGTFSGDWFHVFAGDESRRPRILSKGETVPSSDRDLVVAVPVEYRSDFETDLVSALRDIAGRSTQASHPFLMNIERLSECFGRRRSIFTRTDVDFVETQLGIYPKRIQTPKFPRWVHIDLALTGDSAGVAMGFVKKFVSVRRGETIERLPVVAIDGTLEVRPPKGGEIPIWKIRELVYRLLELGVNVRWVSFDGYQSADSIQILRQKGLTTGLRSLDRTPEGYELLKTAIYDGRVELPTHTKLYEELRMLERDMKTGKLDHPPHGSKDIADALAGVVSAISLRREVWFSHGEPIMSIPASLKPSFRVSAPS